MTSTSYDVDAYVVELRAKIRELEAELVSTREALNHAWSVQRAASTSAEKAEALYRGSHDEVIRLEARVAELEAREKED